MNRAVKETSDGQCELVSPECTDIATTENTPPVVIDQNPYVQMIAAAAAQDLDADKLEKLMDLHERHQRTEARKEYLVAVAAFSEDPPIVLKDKRNDQYDSNYASLENTAITLGKHLGKFGLKAYWQIDQSAGISVTCVLSHVAGHSEEVTISGPPDTSGKKNELQQIKSTITYLKLATLESITGTASAQGSTDDDGNSADVQYITEKQAVQMRDELESMEADETFFCDWLKIPSLEEMPAKVHAKARRAIADQKRQQQ